MNSNASQKNYICSICKSYFIDPVTTECGHNFCRPCLYTFWEEASNALSCPECKKSCSTNVKDNIRLNIRVFLARRAVVSSLQSSEQQMCEIHMRPKTFFCEVFRETLCFPCRNSKEHKSHLDCSIEWTAEKYRQKLLEQMRSLWREKQENQRHLHRQIRIIKSWK
ncbi:PREDICTED: tripartite motif-containing protein 51-like, partial [Elephantulus edwardii]|uniref:tripartite motif-containing protein 51-like n=1 Tax=Elephantulus edwardii TaxID=28737 RepID=UPI0003F0B984